MTDPTENVPESPVTELPEDDELDVGDIEDDGDSVIDPEVRAPSIPPGPRRLLIPEGESVRRVDRFVADRTMMHQNAVACAMDLRRLRPQGTVQ